MPVYEFLALGPMSSFLITLGFSFFMCREELTTAILQGYYADFTKGNAKKAQQNA